MKGPRTAALATGCLRTGGLLVGVADAAIPDGGVITGCYTTGTGALRVIDSAAGQRCTPLETALSWNQQGPPAVSLWANVNAAGRLLGGSHAISAQAVSVNVYRIEWPRQL